MSGSARDNGLLPASYTRIVLARPRVACDLPTVSRRSVYSRDWPQGMMSGRGILRLLFVRIRPYEGGSGNVGKGWCERACWPFDLLTILVVRHMI